MRDYLGGQQQVAMSKDRIDRRSQWQKIALTVDRNSGKSQNFLKWQANRIIITIHVGKIASLSKLFLSYSLKQVKDGRKVRRKIGRKWRWKIGTLGKHVGRKMANCTMLQFITRMGYHFRQKIGGKSAEICENRWNQQTCGRKNGGGVPSHRWKIRENAWKIDQILPKIAILSCREDYFTE